MAFIQPCFIRKNTLELRRKLEELGYENRGKVRYYGEPIYIYCEMDIFYTSPCKLKIPDNYIIDCGDNEELFLALAALRDDSDYMQWFTYNNYWHKCLDNNFSKYAADWILFPNADVWHKATIKEIIEHFKDK